MNLNHVMNIIKYRKKSDLKIKQNFPTKPKIGRHGNNK